MDDFVTYTITGLCTAGIFAIAASGLVLTYTTTGIFNFAHGAIGMLGAYAYWQLIEWGVPTGLALALVLLAVAPALGVFIDVAIMRSLATAPETARLVVSVAMLAAALGLGVWLWPDDIGRPLDSFFPGETVSVLGVSITWHSALALVLAVLVAAGLRFLLFRTRTGITMRAVVDDRSLAMLNGARTSRSSALAWAIGSSLAALAGILLAAQQTLTHLPLTLLVVNAYAAAMIGRLRNLPLTFAGAALLGLLDSWAFQVLPTEGRWRDYFNTGFRPAIPVIVLFLVLIALPSARLRTGAGRRKLAAPVPTWSGAMTTAVALVAGVSLVAVQLSQADALKGARMAGLALIALSLVPLVGWAGQLCLCQMSFAAIGAMTMGQLGAGGNPLALLVGAAIAAVVGALVAWPALRLSGIELALATAAFAVILDRWIFALPTFHVGPLSVSFFDRGAISVPRLDLPGTGALSNRGLFVVIAVVLAIAHLGVVAVRRSHYGERLLALRESPAACATLGMSPSTTRLAVFAFSAGLAAAGGGLYATALGSANPQQFDLFQSLPLLLVAVAGGVSTTGGALFAGLVLGGLPLVAAKFRGLAGLLGILPGTIGLTLGRNPDGAVPQILGELAALRESRSGKAVTALLELAVFLSWAWLGLSGWLALIVGFLLPFNVSRAVAPRAARAADPLDGLEVAGLDRPVDPDVLARLDRELALAEVPRR